MRHWWLTCMIGTFLTRIHIRDVFWLYLSVIKGHQWRILSITDVFTSQTMQYKWLVFLPLWWLLTSVSNLRFWHSEAWMKKLKRLQCLATNNPRVSFACLLCVCSMLTEVVRYVLRAFQLCLAGICTRHTAAVQDRVIHGDTVNWYLWPHNNFHAHAFVGVGIAIMWQLYI